MTVLIRKVRSALYLAKSFVVSQRFGFDPVKIYAQSFYEDGGFHATERSANAIADWIAKELAPKSILDLGSGAGHYLRAFRDRGIETLGLEASPAGVAASGAGTLAVTCDLRRPVHVSRLFDVVMCVEVAEHLPKRCSETLVESICRNSGNFAVFTAAPPGTPRGTDHINCQPPSFWLPIFEKHGFILRQDLTDSLRAVARNANTAEWWKSWAFCLEKKRGSGAPPEPGAVAR